MRIEHLAAEAAVAALEPEWSLLLRESAANSVFLTPEWLQSWWSAYGQQKKLCVLVARNERGHCVGIAPLYTEATRFGPRLRFIGDGSHDSDYLDFIVARGEESQVSTAFWEHLARGSVHWNVMQLNEIPASSPTIASLTSYAQRTGLYLETEPVLCGYAELPADWEQFLKTLRPRFRTSVRACLRNLTEWSGQFEILQDWKSAPEWLEDLFALHSDRWTLRDQNGVFATPEKRRFYQAMTRAFIERGFLHMTRWRVKDRVLSCQFGFVYKGTYHLLQEGFEPECSHVSPGITLRAATIRDLIARGVRGYDFLGGLGRHKTDWGAEEKRCVRLAIAKRGFRGYSYARLPIVIESAKQNCKALLPEAALKQWKEFRAGSSRKHAEVSRANGETRRPGWKQSLASGLYRTGAVRLLENMSRQYELRKEWGGVPLVHKSAGPKFAILCYHRIGAGGVPLYSELSPEVFSAQMRFLAERYRVISLDELCDELDSPRTTGPAVAVTFDDGYRDVFQHAFPVLQHYKIPATIFLTVEAIETDGIAWYDRIFLVLHVHPAEKLDVLLDRPRRFLLADWKARLQAAETIISYLRTRPDCERIEFCESLEQGVALPPEQSTGRMLSWDQIRTMSKAGVSFGSHTLTHPAISRLDPLHLQRELLESKSKLEERLGRRVDHFAYPFGKSADYVDTPSIVAGCGYRSASTTLWGINTPGQNPYELRRISLGEELHISDFAVKLAQLFLTSSTAVRAIREKRESDKDAVSLAN